MPEVRRTRATLRRAELGFLGVWVNTRVQTPRRWGDPLRAGDFDFSGLVSRPLRTSCWIVGTDLLRASNRLRNSRWANVGPGQSRVSGGADSGPTVHASESGPRTPGVRRPGSSFRRPSRRRRRSTRPAGTTARRRDPPTSAAGTDEAGGTVHVKQAPTVSPKTTKDPSPTSHHVRGAIADSPTW